MASYNRVVLMGNLTRDPQLSYTQSNTAVCKFGLAVNHRWKDRDGGNRDEVCYVDCTVFGRAAETFNQYMAKGRSVLIEGRLQFNQWTTPEGDKRSKHEVVVDNFTFVGNRPDGGAQGGESPSSGAGGRMPVGSGSPSAGPGVDEVPF